MARKRSLFYITIQSLIRGCGILLKSVKKISLVGKRLPGNKAIGRTAATYAIFLISALLIVGMSPVFAQIPASGLVTVTKYLEIVGQSYRNVHIMPCSNIQDF
ncbi:MAG: hypothetical protein AAFW70_21185 [Cyanobacteria bacterium J06635_10]